MWADGKTPRITARFLTQQVIRPLKKESGGARPISLMEVLFKFASGVVQDAVRAQGGEGLGKYQYGAHPAGP